MRGIVGSILIGLALVVTCLVIGATPLLMLGGAVADLGNKDPTTQSYPFVFVLIGAVYVAIILMWVAIIKAARRGWLS